jgi:transcriptional regulator with XRE-family HTH domain
LENLFAFIRAIRTAQGITQRDIATYLGIHRTAITLFEDGRSKLSLATLVRMAPFLNLNPSFIESGAGSPFKPKRTGEVIKFLVFPRPERGVDLYLLNLILTKAEKPRFAILLPPLEQAKRKLGTQGFYYAIVAQDDEGTMYLLRGKDGERLTGSIVELQAQLDAIASKEEKDFHWETVRVNKELFEKLRSWSIRGTDELSGLFEQNRKAASRQILLRLVDTIFPEEEKDTAKKAAVVIDQEEVNHIISRVKTDLNILLSTNIGDSGE